MDTVRGDRFPKRVYLTIKVSEQCLGSQLYESKHQKAYVGSQLGLT